MALMLEAVRRADGRLALFHGDRCVGHLAAGEAPGELVPQEWTDRAPAAAPASKDAVQRRGVKKAVRPASPRTTAAPASSGRRGRTTPLDATDPRMALVQRAIDRGEGTGRAARLAGVSESTLYLWRKRGLIAFGPQRAGAKPASSTPRAPRPRRGRSAAGSAQDGPAALRRCPICQTPTASRYCPNGHDIYLDAELETAGHARRPDTGNDDDDDEFA